MKNNATSVGALFSVRWLHAALNRDCSLASSEIRIFIGSREGRETTCNIAGPTLFARWKPLCLSAVSSSTR